MADKTDEILRQLRDQNQEIDTLSRNVTRLVRVLEQDDHLQERTERLAEEERDRRHKDILRTLKELPDKLLNHIERKIYELRIERHKAREAGFLNEPAPLPLPPTQREPTGKVPTLPGTEDTGSIALTAAQQRGLWFLIKKGWEYKWHGVGGAVGLHWLWERGAALWEIIKHAVH